MNRRFFLKGTLAVAATAVAASPALSLLKKYPTLHGDGVTDDTEALQAMLSGEPVVVEGELVSVGENDVIHLNSGTYLTSAPIEIRRDHTWIEDCDFKFSGKRCFTHSGNDVIIDLRVRNCRFESMQPGSTAIFLPIRT